MRKEKTELYLRMLHLLKGTHSVLHKIQKTLAEQKNNGTTKQTHRYKQNLKHEVYIAEITWSN